MATSKITRQPTGHIAPFGLRMQPELKEQLEQAATAAGRSLNAEIVARLEQTLGGSRGVASTGASLLITDDNMDQVAELLIQRLGDRGLVIRAEEIESPAKRIPRTRAEKIIK